MKENDRKCSIFKKTGHEFGFQGVEVTFYPYKELKSKWMKNGQKISLKISDYLLDADETVIVDYAHSLFQRIVHGKKIEHSERINRWLNSSQFIERNREKYLERSRNLSPLSSGNHHDLEKLHQDLVDRRLINGNQDVRITWTKRPNRRRVGYCSLLMKVVTVSSALDSPSVPAYVPQYVLHHELLHLEMRTDSLSAHHCPQFRRREREFPRWAEAEEWLKKVASNVK